MPDKHSKLAPSAAKRWMNCPGCIRLSEGIEETTSVYAKEGSLAHYVAEWALKNGENTDKINDTPMLGGVTSAISASSVVPGKGEYITLKDRPEAPLPQWITGLTGKPNERIVINQDMIDYTQQYVDLVRSENEGMEIQVEKSFDLSWLAPGMHGTNDANAGDFMGTLRVYDLKYGRGVIVEPEENPQQMLYALGAIGKHNKNEYEDVEIIIVQPRAPHPDGPVRRWRISVAELMAWSKTLKVKAEATEDPKAPLCVGNHCQFCPAMAVCPEVVKEAANSAMIEFGSDDPIRDIAVSTISLPASDALSAEQVARILDFSKIIAAWAKEVEAYAQNRMESGVMFPGYKLVAKRANRKWTDESSTVDFLHAVHGDTIYSKPKLKTVAQIEKLTGIDKKALAFYWDKPEAGVTIAPESDKRQGVQPSAVEDFTEKCQDMEILSTLNLKRT